MGRSLTLLMLHGCSYREIGEVLRFSEMNVRVKLTRVRKRLAEQVAAMERVVARESRAIRLDLKTLKLKFIVAVVVRLVTTLNQLPESIARPVAIHPMRTRFVLLVSLFSLGVGFAVGLIFGFSKSNPGTLPTESTAGQPVAPASPPVGQPEGAEAVSTVVAQPKSAEAAPSVVQDEKLAWAQRSETLLWLQEVGVPMRLNAFQGREPSKALSRFLELTPAESTVVAEAIHRAGAELDRLRAERATSRLNEDGTLWVVEMPAIDTASSGAIYDALHGTLRTTLGEERFALLNVVAGDSLERAYDRYGLNDVRYEINLQPKEGPVKGDRVHDYKRHTSEAGGMSTGWSGGSSTLAALAKQDPLLERLSPPAAETRTAK